jgi:hypothetical protein
MWLAADRPTVLLEVVDKYPLHVRVRCEGRSYDVPHVCCVCSFRERERGGVRSRRSL